jgi:hypothetical protein
MWGEEGHLGAFTGTTGYKVDSLHDTEAGPSVHYYYYYYYVCAVCGRARVSVCACGCVCVCVCARVPYRRWLRYSLLQLNREPYSTSIHRDNAYGWS